MGKIKVRTLGGDEEQVQKNEQKKKSEDRKLAKVQGSGGQRIPAVGPTEEELAKLDEVKAVEEIKLSEAKSASGGKSKKEKFQKAKHVRSKAYQVFAQLVDNSQSLSVPQALDLLEKLQRKTFDETVELHLNTSDPKISASTTLPHGTGKTLRVAVANDELLAEIETGKVNFDILLATPDMMPKLAKVAKVLGPKGLMPNPKSGTVTQDVVKAVKEVKAGKIEFRVEKAGIVHTSLGKLNFDADKLVENTKAFFNTIVKLKPSSAKGQYIKSVFLSSTMSPGLKINKDEIAVH